jgi:DNA-binding CsgD family transcriptional regulator
MSATALAHQTAAPALAPTLTEEEFDAQLCLLSGLELRKCELTLPPVEELCAWCLEHGAKGCPACTQRRRKALRLIDEGHTIDQIADALQINRERVERLLEQDADRRDVEQYRVSHVDNSELKAAFLRWKAEDPKHSAAELARLSGLSCSSHVERELGLLETSDSYKHGTIAGLLNVVRVYPGRLKATTSVANAEKLLRGLGYDPVDVERLLAGERL